MRGYTREVDPETDVFTVEEWKEAVANGSFVNDDGSGFWMKDGKESQDEVFSTEPEDATHVAWYNK